MFMGLGDLPGGRFRSFAWGVSADGSVVVGYSDSTSGTEAFRWTSSGGMSGLGDLPGGLFGSYATGVSADGSVVVGRSTPDAPAHISVLEAFRWTDLNGNGLVDPDEKLDNHPEFGLGDLPGGYSESQVSDISADGSVVVGIGRPAPSGYEAFRWEDLNGNGLVDPGEKLDYHPEFGLGDLPGSSIYSHANGVSADGSVVVGSGYPASAESEALIWTSDGEMVRLGKLPGMQFSVATAVSADGSVVFGQSQEESPEVMEAFIWDATNGMRNLRDVLVDDCGLDLSGWTLRIPRDASDDGLTIVGEGLNPSGDYEGWIAVLCEPSIPVEIDIKPGSCPNSWNRDSNGVLPVAILGTEDFDVTQIDVASVTISRADGTGGSAAPNEGPPGPHSEFEDVGTPFEGEECGCHEAEGDGILDLSMKFRTQDVANLLPVDDPNGALVPLVVSGTLLDGTPFTSNSDCVRLVPPGSPPGQVTVQTAEGSWIDATPVDNNLDGGGFGSFQRTYPYTTWLTLTAPSGHDGNPFVGWKLDGGELIQQRELTFIVNNAEHTARAVFKRAGSCGIGSELAFLLPPLLWLYGRRRRRML